ncbi:MAG: bifunctional oligoribonuclease/PAP phosphatase NrnA [Phycisphaerae bacterium]
MEPVSPLMHVPDEIIEGVGALRTPVILAHVVPDADALGSLFATARAWTSTTCQPRVSLPPGSLSQRLTFLHEWADVTVAEAQDVAAADGFVVLDTAKKSRCLLDRALKETDWSAGRPIINIDHHETNTGFGDVNWVVSDAGSTCELVYRLLVAADRPIDAVTASLLFAGVHTDTLGFSLPTTTAATLQAGADLVALGADVAELGRRLYRSLRLSEFNLLRIIYDNTATRLDGRIAYSGASYEEIHDAGCTAADIDDQISVVRSLEGARLAMLFTEGRQGKTRINFRGAADLAVLDLARRFNGGGHRHAAGAILDLGLREAIERVLPLAEAYVEANGSIAGLQDGGGE